MWEEKDMLSYYGMMIATGIGATGVYFTVYIVIVCMAYSFSNEYCNPLGRSVTSSLYHYRLIKWSFHQ